MDFIQLEYLRETVRTGSFAKTAELMFTSRQNVSQSIRALEDELGGTLFFRRVGNSMQLTKEGAEALRFANRLLSTRQDMVRSFTQKADERVTLHVLLSANLLAYGQRCVIEAVFGYEKVRLVVSEHGAERCYFRVKSERDDAAVIVCMPTSFEGCVVRDLGSGPFYALVKKDAPLAGLGQLDVDDLVGHRLLLMSDPDFQFGQLMRKLDDVGYDRNGIIQLASAASMQSAMQSLDAVALVNPDYLGDDVSSQFVAIPFSDPTMRWHVYALRAENSKTASDVDKLFDCMELR